MRARALAWLPGPVASAVQRAEGADIPQVAASLAFYGLVSIVPAVIMVLWIVGLVLGDRRVQSAAHELARVAPKGIGADELMLRVARLGTSLGLWAVVGALWPATSYGAGLTRAFDRLSPGKGRELKGLRGRGLALVALMPVLVLGGIGGAFAGTAFVGSGGAWAIVGWALALAIAFGVVAFAVALIFRIFPPQPLGWRGIAFGTAVAAGGIATLSLLFALYLSFGANFQQHYATSGLAGVVLLAVWLFLSNVLVLVGFQAALEA